MIHISRDPTLFKIDADMEDAIEAVRARYAKKILAYYRKRVARFKTHNHTIAISSAMGSDTVDVNGKAVVYSSLSHYQTPLIRELVAISESLSNDWAHHLHGELLNVPNGKVTKR